MPPEKSRRRKASRRKSVSGSARRRTADTRRRSETVWISPDLERRTKGARGLRGSAESPAGHYLALADIFLGAESLGTAPPVQGYQGSSDAPANTVERNTSPVPQPQ